MTATDLVNWMSQGCPMRHKGQTVYLCPYLTRVDDEMVMIQDTPASFMSNSSLKTTIISLARLDDLELPLTLCEDSHR